MCPDYYHRFELAYTPFFVRKRVGKCFKVIRRFRTYEEASNYVRLMFERYPGINFDIKHVSIPHLDKKSSI